MQQFPAGKSAAYLALADGGSGLVVELGDASRALTPQARMHHKAGVPRRDIDEHQTVQH